MSRQKDRSSSCRIGPATLPVAAVAATVAGILTVVIWQFPRVIDADVKPLILEFGGGSSEPDDQASAKPSVDEAAGSRSAEVLNIGGHLTPSEPVRVETPGRGLILEWPRHQRKKRAGSLQGDDPKSQAVAILNEAQGYLDSGDLLRALRSARLAYSYPVQWESDEPNPEKLLEKLEKLTSDKSVVAAARQAIISRIAPNEKKTDDSLTVKKAVPAPKLPVQTENKVRARTLVEFSTETVPRIGVWEAADDPDDSIAAVRSGVVSLKKVKSAEQMPGHGVGSKKEVSPASAKKAEPGNTGTLKSVHPVAAVLQHRALERGVDADPQTLQSELRKRLSAQAASNMTATSRTEMNRWAASTRDGTERAVRADFAEKGRPTPSARLEVAEAASQADIRSVTGKKSASESHVEPAPFTLAPGVKLERATRVKDTEDRKRNNNDRQIEAGDGHEVAVATLSDSAVSSDSPVQTITLKVMGTLITIFAVLFFGTLFLLLALLGAGKKLLAGKGISFRIELVNGAAAANVASSVADDLRQTVVGEQREEISKTAEEPVAAVVADEATNQKPLATNVAPRATKIIVGSPAQATETDTGAVDLVSGTESPAPKDLSSPAVGGQAAPGATHAVDHSGSGAAQNDGLPSVRLYKASPRAMDTGIDLTEVEALEEERESTIDVGVGKVSRPEENRPVNPSDVSTAVGDPQATQQESAILLQMINSNVSLRSEIDSTKRAA